MTEINTTDIFTKWGEAQKELFEQWRDMYARAIPNAMDPLKPLQHPALPVSVADRRYRTGTQRGTSSRQCWGRCRRR